MAERFTIEMFNELCRSEGAKPIRKWTIPISFQEKLWHDFMFSDVMSRQKIKWFYTSTKKAFDYAEFTPFNKGCLFKIRRYSTHFKVFFGTKELCYSTSLADCLKVIENRMIKK